MIKNSGLCIIVNLNPTNQNEYSIILEVFRIGLINRLIDKREIVTWADKQILEENEPDYRIIELSLVGNKNEKDLLEMLYSQTLENSLVSGRLIFGILYQKIIKKEIPLKQAIQSIYWIRWNSSLSEKEIELLYGLDDEYELAACNL
ncbi:MAG: hypothetical protein NVV82_27610 [Sporocytophaga sp.]|nr:hypothetical protein [Sporocytophaga sp.]